ncbi:Fic/DOC family protein [Hymenobacter lapidiphilus]|uniref:protein adenylyltransferase n=1 Tax=Hymenobacter lapidiphilus TaxID=2608003 RepID=A0A7Y7U4H4_9BACT|nr:Fic family protein [Hymenobacter lapidiphilus]NVO30691.1 Fic family protein [Hymenobacter lapidiphilus]
MKYASTGSEGEVLPNLLGFTTLAAVQQAETEGSLRAEQALLDELCEDQLFDAAYICEIHRRALAQVYSFAGTYRAVNLSKGGFTFPAAQYLLQSMVQLERETLQTLPPSWPDVVALAADVARIHAELLFIHPFREGNGRTARVLANLMAYKNGSASFRWEKLAEPIHFEQYVQAVQAAGRLDYTPMQQLFTVLLPPE